MVIRASHGLLGVLGICRLGQTVLLEQSIDFLGTPKVVVDFAGLCPADSGEFNCEGVRLIAV